LPQEKHRIGMIIVEDNDPNLTRRAVEEYCAEFNEPKVRRSAATGRRRKVWC
jgi:hypothetical protein